MANILQTFSFTKAFFFIDNCILTQVSKKFVLKGPIAKKSALIQVMAWCLTDDKPLSNAMTYVAIWYP